MTVRVLVTGVQGQLARAFAERTANCADCEVTCMGRPKLDLRSFATVESVVRELSPDVIINAAAYTAVDCAEEEPHLAMRVNGEAVGILARSARTCSARLIQLSTDYVYDGEKDTPYLEGDDVAPQNTYGKSKLDGEARALAELPQTLVLRTSWVFSPFGRNFVKSVIGRAKEQACLEVVEDQRGNPTSALDLADAILAVMASWRISAKVGLGEIYHCAGAGDTTWRGLAERTLEASRAYGGPFVGIRGIKTSDWPGRARRPRNSRLACDKFARDFAWSAPDWRGSVEVVVRQLIAGGVTQNVA